jgi:hypothetical protein
VLLLVGPIFVALGSAPASANSGAVSATQNCQTWHVSVSLNHDVQPDRSVDVLTTIPGTSGISGVHYDTSFGEIWSAGGAAPTSGTVTLNIYYANGQLEFTQSKSLPAPEACVTTTTTAAPTTTTTIVTEGTTAVASTSTSVGSTVPGNTTIVTEGANATTSTSSASVAATTGGTSAVGAATLPRTGSGGPGPAIGFASLLGGGVMLLLSQRRRHV